MVDIPQDKLDAFYREYGRAVEAWAEVEFSLSLAFILVTLLPVKMGSALFYSGRSFQTRRDLLLSALSATELHIADSSTVEFIKASVKKATQFSQARNMLAHRRIMWNEITNQVELREGDDMEIDHEGLVNLEGLSRIADNFDTLQCLMRQTLAPRASKKGLQPEEGHRLVLELPNSALSQTNPTP